MQEKSKKTCFVKELNPEQIQALEHLLLQKDWELHKVPHCLFKGSGNKVSVAAYESGKVVIQGAEAEDFVQFILEPEILKEVSFPEDENQGGLNESNFSPHAGIDESGKGDFFGPLVIACVYVSDFPTAKKLADAGVQDSKLIKSDANIGKLAKFIRGTVQNKMGVVVIGPEAYNKLYEKFHNLNRMLAWGHARALENMLANAPECTMVLADKFGDESLIRNALFKNGQKIQLAQQTKAERDIAVAAASIMARAEFVRRLELLGKEHGCTFPKGAGVLVDKTASDIAIAGGAELLSKVAKMHFRTSYKALGLELPEKTVWKRPSAQEER